MDGVEKIIEHATGTPVDPIHQPRQSAGSRVFGLFAEMQLGDGANKTWGIVRARAAGRFNRDTIELK